MSVAAVAVSIMLAVPAAAALPTAVSPVAEAGVAEVPAVEVVFSDALAVSSDTTDDESSMAWARRVVALRRSLDGARRDDRHAADHALAAHRAARDLADSAVSDDVRALVVEAHALYEAHHGPAAPGAPLAPDELATLRGDALALAVEQAGAPVEALGWDAVAEAANAVVGAQHAWYEYPVRSGDVVARQQDVVRRRFGGMRRRARGYFPMIERTFRRRGVPTELKYLAVVESALNPQAESWAGAAGLWQFMPATAAEFGLDSLTVYDPAASTDAAARYLRQLGRMFGGDWQLALAAYNCGPGRVRKLVRAHRAEHGETPTFWDLYDVLPRETRAYVPRYIAVAEYFGGVEREE